MGVKNRFNVFYTLLYTVFIINLKIKIMFISLLLSLMFVTCVFLLFYLDVAIVNSHDNIHDRLKSGEKITHTQTIN